MDWVVAFSLDYKPHTLTFYCVLRTRFVGGGKSKQHRIRSGAAGACGCGRPLRGG